MLAQVWPMWNPSGFLSILIMCTHPLCVSFLVHICPAAPDQPSVLPSDAELDYGSPGIITYHSSPAARMSLGHFNTSRASLMAMVPTATVHCPQGSGLSSGSLSVCLRSVSLLLLFLCYLCMFGGSHNTFSTYALITVCS